MTNSDRGVVAWTNGGTVGRPCTLKHVAGPDAATIYWPAARRPHPTSADSPAGISVMAYLSEVANC